MRAESLDESARSCQNGETDQIHFDSRRDLLMRIGDHSAISLFPE